MRWFLALGNAVKQNTLRNEHLSESYFKELFPGLKIKFHDPVDKHFIIQLFLSYSLPIFKKQGTWSFPQTIKSRYPCKKTKSHRCRLTVSAGGVAQGAGADTEHSHGVMAQPFAVHGSATRTV